MKKIIRFMQRENLFNLLLAILTIVLVSGVLISFFEEGISLGGGVWWSLVTLTTVGYGDISPATTGGRILAVIIMFFGIGLLGTLSATLAALLISKRIKENKGMCATEIENHIILCEWNHRSEAIYTELRGDPKTAESPIVLIAEIQEKPVDDPELIFIHGAVCEATLEKANLAKAHTVIILGDDNLDAMARDAKVVLSTLTIESMNNDAYTVVELVDKKNEIHCQRANADEIIVGSELGSHLVATAAVDHGISRIISELLSNSYGNELFSMQVPATLAGKSFLDVMVAMKKEEQTTVIGIQKGQGGELFTNPEIDYTVLSGDYLVVISKERQV